MPFFIENPADEYGNRAYTASQPQIVEAEVSVDEHGCEVMNFITPEIRAKWPTALRNSYCGWTEVEGPARKLTVEEWRSMVGL